MGKGRDFRGAPRRRGFNDDDVFVPRDMPRPARPFGGAPSRDGAPAEGPPVQATVKWFKADKGFGFAELADGSGDAFLHINVLQNAGHDAVGPGARLRVTVGQGPKGRQITSVLEVEDAGSPVAPSYHDAQPRSAPRPRPSAPDPSTAVEVQGAVKWFASEKGFGFIAADDGGNDVFIHISVLERSGLSPLAEGQRVTMRVVQTQKGREAIALTLE